MRAIGSFKENVGEYVAKQNEIKREREREH